MFTVILCNCALIDDEPVKLENMYEFMHMKNCEVSEVCALDSSHCNNFITMYGMENVKFRKNEV
jgi:hypothetical protein